MRRFRLRTRKPGGAEWKMQGGIDGGKAAMGKTQDKTNRCLNSASFLGFKRVGNLGWTLVAKYKETRENSIMFSPQIRERGGFDRQVQHKKRKSSQTGKRRTRDLFPVLPSEG